MESDTSAQQTELQRTLTSTKQSSLKKYQSLALGEGGLWALFRYELILTLFNTNVWTNCVMQSESNLKLGKNILLESYCYLVAGGNHGIERTDIPIIEQPPVSKGGIAIEDNVWLGARVTVADGIRVGRDSVAGAATVIIRDVPEFVIVGGVSTKVVKERRAEASSDQPNP